MNCREFEDLWNEVLDDRLSSASELEKNLEAHASSCELCRAASARFQMLRQGIAASPPPPLPSPELFERLLALPATAIIRRGRFRRSAVRLAMAASILALAWMGHLALRPGDSPTLVAKAPKPPSSPPRPLGAALEEAKRATLDLAREASAPAARIGREVLDFEERELAASVAPSELVDDPDLPTPVLLQSVGQKVNARVQPISGSARHAFSFLLGPAPEPAATPPASQDSL